jgi:hypothetical protein
LLCPTAVEGDMGEGDRDRGWWHGGGGSDSESPAAAQIAPASDEPRRRADLRARELCRCAGSAGTRALPRAQELRRRVGSGGVSACSDQGPPWAHNESFGDVGGGAGVKGGGSSSSHHRRI